MSYRILYTERYIRRAARFLKLHPDLLARYEKTLKLLELNPFHPSLRLHRLKGPLNDLYSVSINISYRITLEFLIDGDAIVPVDVGTQGEMY